MAHPQNSPRGLFAKNRIDTGSQSLTYNSTGLILGGALFVSGQTTVGKVSANSTAIILPNSVRVGTKATYLSSDSTGVKLGARYISTNTTGNTNT